MEGGTDLYCRWENKRMNGYYCLWSSYSSVTIHSRSSPHAIAPLPEGIGRR